MGGPKTFGRTKKLNSRKSLGDQTTWRTNRIQEVERERKLNIDIELDENFDLAHPKYQNNLIIKHSRATIIYFGLVIGGSKYKIHTFDVKIYAPFLEDQMDPKSAVGRSKPISRTGHIVLLFQKM